MELGLKVGIDLCKKKWLHIMACLHSDSNSDSNPNCQLQEWNRNPSLSPTITRPFTMRRDVIPTGNHAFLQLLVQVECVMNLPQFISFDKLLYLAYVFADGVIEVQAWLTELHRGFGKGVDVA